MTRTLTTRPRLAAAFFSFSLLASPMALPLIAAPAASVMLLPAHPAEARPGGGSSIGSRGSRTYLAPPATRTAPGGAMPFNRSVTPRPYGTNSYGGGYGTPMRSHPFAAGFLGGLIGAGIGGLLIGHGFFGPGLGFGGLIGLLLQIAIIVFIVRWLIRRFAGGGRGLGPKRMPAASGRSGSTTPGTARPGASIAITNTDYAAFEQALLDIQQAWSMQDIRSLQRFATPEMVAYFNEQLSELASRNLRNVVSNVRMEQGDLAEAWTEGDREYATVAMRYSLIDVTTDITGRVVDGSPDQRQIVTELWTFMRAPRGSWLLSAIQQAR